MLQPEMNWMLRSCGRAQNKDEPRPVEAWLRRTSSGSHLRPPRSAPVTLPPRRRDKRSSPPFLRSVLRPDVERGADIKQSRPCDKRNSSDAITGAVVSQRMPSAGAQFTCEHSWS